MAHASELEDMQAIARQVLGADRLAESAEELAACMLEARQEQLSRVAKWLAFAAPSVHAQFLQEFRTP